MHVHTVAVVLALNGLAYADPIPAVGPTKYSTYSVQSFTSGIPSSPSFTTSHLSPSSTSSSTTTSSTTTSSTTTLSTSTSSTSTSTSTTSSTTTSSSTTSSTTTIPACTPSEPPIGVSDANGWQYQGCQTDTQEHILYPGPTTLNLNTFEYCRVHCSTGENTGQRYAYIGLQQGNLCWCSHTLATNTNPTLTVLACNAPCAGDACQLCGGPSDQIDIYYNPTIDATAPRIKQQSDDYRYFGCYNDEGSDKLLVETTYYDTTGFVVDDCIEFCRTYAGGQGSASSLNAYQLAGVENGDTCYCGNNFDTDNPIRVDDRECDTVCDDPSDPGEFCGGGSSGLRLQVYQLQIA